MESTVKQTIEQNAASRRQLEFELRHELPSYSSHTELITKVLGEQELRPGGMDQTGRMLVTLGVALTSGDKSMIEYSITRALNHGAKEAQILDVLDVAILAGGGAVVSNVRFAYEAFKIIQVSPEKTKDFLFQAQENYSGQG